MSDFALSQTVIRLDIVQSSAGDRARQMHLDAGMQAVLKAVFAKAPQYDPASWVCRTDGDSVTIVVPATVPKAWLASDFIRMMDIELRQVNRHSSATSQLRTRVAISHGEVVVVPPNIAGRPVAETARLVDATQLRAAMDLHRKANLALIVSHGFFTEVVEERELDLDPADFTEVVVVVKDYSRTAWIRKIVSEDEDNGVRTQPVGPVPSPTQPGARSLNITGNGNTAANGDVIIHRR